MHNILYKNVPVFLCAASMLIFQIKRIISSENGLTTSFHRPLFFWENGKNLGGSYDAKQRKKRMA